MASISYKPSKDYMDKLNQLGDDDKLYKDIAKSAAAPLLAALKQSLKPYQKTGQLIKSLKAKVNENKTNGTYFARVIATGYRTNGRRDANSEIGSLSNNQVFIMLEYGTSKIKGAQPPRPVIDKAERAAEEEAVNAMQRVIDRRAKELGL